MTARKDGQTLWGRAVVARQAHNLKVGGSIPSPATNTGKHTANFLDKNSDPNSE